MTIRHLTIELASGENVIPHTPVGRIQTCDPLTLRVLGR